MDRSIKVLFTIIFVITLMFSCKPGKNKDEVMKTTDYKEGSFGYDLKLLKESDENLVVLTNNNGKSQVIVSAKYQGKVFTSTAEGLSGNSFGWINHELIKSGEIAEHMNAYGSEDRLWFGPEGGQYSIFFEPGVSMDFENWFTPAPIDSESWELISNTDTEASIRKNMILKNYSNTEFSLRVNRKIKLLEETEISGLLNISIPEDVNFVGFESENIVTNSGNNSWTKSSGTISIWILSMFNPSEDGTVVIPYNQGEEKKLGKIATTNYFGEIPADRIKIDDNALFFKVDGKWRSKLGLAYGRVKNIAGSYDEVSGTLTIVQYSLPEQNREYINQLWEIQDEPFVGDVLNSYNDGPLEDGSQLGPFYELESSSPAAFLAPGEHITHYHRVIHFVGNSEDLDKISMEVLGVKLKEIVTAF